MIDVIHPKCIKCNTIRPCYANVGEKRALYCASCKDNNMINIVSKRCIKCEETIATFGKEGQKTFTHCSNCKESDMIDIKHLKNRCVVCNLKQASFAKIGEITVSHCSNCKESDMVNIKTKKCIKCEEKIPTFAYVGDKIPTHCFSCKEVSMVDIKHPKCVKCNKIRPSFAKSGDSMASHCVSCKDDDMIDVNHYKCIICKVKRPFYGKIGTNKALYCVSCKTEDMVDIQSKKCSLCDKQVKYGYCGQSAIYCATHRDSHADKNFLYKQSKRRCIGNDDEECKDIAEYGKKEPTHCSDHKTDDEIHLVAQKCSQCCKNDLLNKEGLCITYCAPNQLYQQNKKEKKKEMIVMNYLDNNVKIENIINIRDDKVVNTYCNYYRPDRIYDIGTHYVIIEVDEEQHKGKRSSCSKGEIGELARMHEIQNAVGMNCIFLRFNPDTFKVNNKLQKVSINQRLKLLVKWIEKCVEMRPDKDLQPVKYKYLYYDDWNETDITFKEIDDTKLYDK
jgi:hypothetical protein